MKSGLGDYVRTPGYRPSLRQDIRFLKGDAADLVVVHDPVGDRRFEMYETECVIAREMNGVRDLDEVTRIAKKHVPFATRSQVESLAVQFAGMGLLANVPATLRARPSAQQLAVTPPPSHDPPAIDDVPPDHSDGLDDWTALSDGPVDVDGPPAGAPAHFASGASLASPGPPARGSQPAHPRLPALPAAPAIPPAATPRRSSPHLQPRATSAAGSQPHQVPAPVQASTPAAPSEDRSAFSPTPTRPGFAAPTPPPEPPPSAALPSMPAQAGIPAPPPVPEPAAPPAPSAAPTPASAIAGPPADLATPWEVEKQAWFRRHRGKLVLAFVAVVIAVLALVPYPLYVTESCIVIPLERAQVRSQVEGIIAEVLVKEGDLVKQGTPLVRLDDRDLMYALRQAEANVDRLGAGLAKVQSGNRPEEIRRAKAQVDARGQDVRFAGMAATRQQKLFSQGVASAAQRDEARRDLEVKRSALVQAQAELKLVQSGARSEELTIAQAELRSAEVEVEYLKQKMELLVVRSPIAGRVLTPKVHERLHERITAGDELCEIGSSDVMRVEILVPEQDADVLRAGQPVRVKVKSYPLEVFEGTVGLIAPAVDVRDGERILRVEAEVKNPKGLLRPRMSGYAEIETEDRTILTRIVRRAVRWIRVRFLI